MATTSAHSEPHYMTPEIAALVTAEVEAQVAARLSNYHNKAVIRGKPVVPVTLVVGEVFGVCEAFLIQQIHFWCVSHGHLKNGHKWSRNTYAQWAEQLRMFSERSVERALKRLVTLGVVATGVFNARIYDRTLWYRLDYERMCKLMSFNVGGNWEVRCPDNASLSITETDADPAAKSTVSEPANLAPPIPEIPKNIENKKIHVFSKQSAELTATPAGLIKTGTEKQENKKKEEIIEEGENNGKGLGKDASAPNTEFISKPAEAVKPPPAPGWMNAGKPLPPELQKRAERAVKAAKAESILEGKLEEEKVHNLSSKPMVLFNHWQACVAAKYGGYQHPPTKQNSGQFKKLGKYLGDQSQAVITYAVDNWWKFAAEASAIAGIGSWPTNPDIGFLLKHHAVAVNLLAKKNMPPQVHTIADEKKTAITDPKPSDKTPVEKPMTKEEFEEMFGIVSAVQQKTNAVSSDITP